MRILFNAAASIAINSNINSGHSLQRSLERLSTGLRVNRASDDAAGLSISEGMRAQVRGTHQAVRNVQDGMALFQIEEGTMSEMENILQRMRELAIQASTDTLTDTDRAYVQDEAMSLLEELDRQARVAPYQNSFQLDGSAIDYERRTAAASEAISEKDAITLTDPGTFQDYLGKLLEITILQDAVAQELEDASVRSEHIQETLTGWADAVLTDNTITGSASGIQGANPYLVSLTTSNYDPLDQDVELRRKSDNGVIGSYTLLSAVPVPESTAFSIQVNGTDMIFALAGEARTADAGGVVTIDSGSDIETVDYVQEQGGGEIKAYAAGNVGDIVYQWAGGGSRTLTVGTKELLGGFTPLGGLDILIDYTGWESEFEYDYESFNKYQVPGAGAETSGGAIQFAEDLYSGTDIPDDVNNRTCMEVRINGNSAEDSYITADSYGGLNNILIFMTDAAVPGSRSASGPVNGATVTVDYTTPSGNDVDWENGTLGENTTTDGTVTPGEALAKDGIWNDFWSVHGSNTITIEQANRNRTTTLALDPAWTPTDMINALNTQFEIDDLEAEAYWDDTAKEVRLRPGTSGWKTRDYTDWEGSYFELSGDVFSSGSVLGAGSSNDAPASQNNFKQSETTAAASSRIQVKLVETGQIIEDSTSTWNMHTLSNIGLRIAVLADAAAGSSSKFVVGGTSLQAGANNSDNDSLMFGLPDVSADALGLDLVNLRTSRSARTSITALDDAIKTISGQRVYFGTLINKAEHTVNYLSLNEQNTQFSESLIRDTNMASEFTAFTRSQILQSASTAVLAQANASHRSVMRLLDSL